MRISDWSSDVCSSDLLYPGRRYNGSSSGAMAPNTGRSDGRSFNNSREGRNMLLTTLKHAAKHAALGVGLALAISGAAQAEKVLRVGNAGEPHSMEDRTSAVSGKSVSVRVVLGGRRALKQN